MKVKAVNGLVRILRKEGVRGVSTFPTNVFNNACGEEGLPNLMMRDERYAVAVADGYSRVSNGNAFGVCSVMGGANAAGTQMAYGALAQAYEDSVPLLCLTDGVPLGSLGRERFNIQSGFSSVTKWSGYINAADRVPEYMRRAFTQLRTGRPAPVLLELPRGLGELDEDAHTYTPVPRWRSQGDPRDVERAIRALKAATAPILYAGQGVFSADACDELRAFAEMARLPVLTTLKAKSAFPEDHPLSLGVRGEPAERFLKGADTVITVGVGTTLSHFGHTIPADKRIIQCTVDGSDLNLGYAVDHAIIGDAKLVLRQLTEELERQGSRPGDPGLTGRIEEARKVKMKKYGSLMESGETPVNPYRVYAELMNVLDMENSFVTHESGNTRDQLSTVYEARVPHGFLGWGNVTTLGFGLGASIGAKLAMPERQVVSVTGDAGVGYQMGNWEALKRHSLGVTTVHINNDGFGGYGPGFWGKGHSPYTYEVTDHDLQSTAKVAEALGIKAERVEDPDEVAPALRRALKANAGDEPYLIEAICCKHPVYGGWVRG
ncbi:MAG TPA: thiamine pyrophosphate-dependent enzyme [Patescibacteria group bacterium]|nr:thiamine pyrophosphate-dependent enzyme [Patescibacteria group bacterium]